MNAKRKRFTAEEKVKLLRLHLVEKEPVSDICDRHGLNPNVFYHWQKQFFENGTAAFDRKSDSGDKKLTSTVKALKEKLVKKDEVIAEIMASHVELKKSLGET